MPDPIRVRIARWIAGSKHLSRLASVSVQVADDPGWGSLSSRPHEYDLAKLQELYSNSLDAWRKNPLAWRIVNITTDYVVGDHLVLTSDNRALNKFIERFWNHPKNMMDLRLESMCDELTRSGDLFVALFRNPEDGMSYIRFVTKDLITKIETSPNDWETELSFIEQGRAGQGDIAWLSPNHPQAGSQAAVMLHYAINRPAGALLGEGDLTTMIPWLQRYSRMLEDRVRLHWALRAFLWIVNVPSNKIKEKIEQYRTAPDTGSIIVKDESETWQAVTPALHGADAEPDLRAVRQMIDAGSGYPPHWRGEPTDVNQSTAKEMQAPTEKHLARRQLYFSFLLQDVIYHAYQRAVEIGRARPLQTANYNQLFKMAATDVAKVDDMRLAETTNKIAESINWLSRFLQTTSSPLLSRKIIKIMFDFLGKSIIDEEITTILDEIFNNPKKPEP